MKKYAIIVAGGEGRRIGGDVPKQFIEIAGKPMLYHTMKAFYDADADIELIVVLHPEFIRDWEDYMSSLHETEQIPYKAVCGGLSRTHSVYNGLYEIRDERDALVAIHDAARPLVTSDMLSRGWQCADENDAAVPVIAETNSLRRIEPDGSSVAVERSIYRIVQTPQVFKASVILDAYARAGIDMSTISRPGELHRRYTDDASVVEAAGYKVAMCEGDTRNIKVTNPIDLKMVELALNEEVC